MSLVFGSRSAPRVAGFARLELIGSLLLAAIGAVIGLALARWAGTVVVAQLSTWASTAVLDLTPDWRVLGVTTVVTVATTVLFGTVPAIRAARVHPVEALNTSRRAVSTSGLGVAGDALVVAQVALALVLVIGAALFVRSFAALVYRDLGFDRTRVLTAVVDVRASATAPRDRPALYERISPGRCRRPWRRECRHFNGHSSWQRRHSISERRAPVRQSDV
jgi:hypothetical protein